MENNETIQTINHLQFNRDRAKNTALFADLAWLCAKLKRTSPDVVRFVLSEYRATLERGEQK